MMLLVLALPSLLVLGQSVSPIHVDVRLVTTSFTVRDGTGKLVNDLTKNDLKSSTMGSSRTSRISHEARTCR
jgi:hypothetical protein